MTIRMIALASAAIVSMLLPATPEAAMAQASRDPCAKLCDCDFDCLDFCSASSCTRPSACKARVLTMKATCQNVCSRCQRLSRAKK